MNFFRPHWYDLGLAPAAAAILYLAARWPAMGVLQRLALLNFAVMLLHQFEEYRFPGGEPAITNLASMPSGDGPADRYPLNQNNAMIINLFAAYVFYLLPVFFPNVLWLGFMPVVFGMSQIIIHGVITPKQIGNRFYSPGFFAVLFGHIPVGAFWFIYTISKSLLSLRDAALGIAYVFLFVFVFMLKIGYGALKSADSKYPFPAAEFARGGYAKRLKRKS